MKQLSLFEKEIEVGDTVYILGRPCTVSKVFWADPCMDGGELYYEILDPTGLGAKFTLSRKHFKVEG